MYLVFSAAHRHRQELVEEMFLLGAADVGHMTCEDAVQSATVSDGGQTQCDTRGQQTPPEQLVRRSTSCRNILLHNFQTLD